MSPGVVEGANSWGQRRGGTFHFSRDVFAEHSHFPTKFLHAMTITMTDAAVDQLESVAAEEDVSLDDTLLRVAVVPGGCSGLTYDLGWDTTVQEQDAVEEHDSITVVLDKKSRLYLDGSELHFTEGLNGDGFHFSNPQASRECACGESFGV
jgi:iron-sulfur cluster assembly protein